MDIKSIDLYTYQPIHCLFRRKIFLSPICVKEICSCYFWREREGGGGVDAETYQIAVFFSHAKPFSGRLSNITTMSWSVFGWDLIQVACPTDNPFQIHELTITEIRIYNEERTPNKSDHSKKLFEASIHYFHIFSSAQEYIKLWILRRRKNTSL